MDINTVRFVFFGFLLIFTILLIAALRIALHKIKDGPKIEETDTTEKIIRSQRVQTLSLLPMRLHSPFL